MARNRRDPLTAIAVVAALVFGGLWVYERFRVPSSEEAVRLFHDALLERAPALENHWLGIQTLQIPSDVWVTQEILSEVKPDFLVETGTYKGGSAAMWATILAPINPAARVITVDIEDRAEEARRLPIVREKVDFVIGSSIDPDVVAEVARRVEGKRVVVILDSEHTKAHVLAELQAYAPLVGVGSYVIVQDSVMNGHPIHPEYGPGPFEAIDAFLATTDAFEIDLSRERYLVTYNPNGFLRRTR